MKLIEADLKRMQSILISYIDQETNLSKEEKSEREYVIKLLREALKMLRHEFEHQTKQFQHGVSSNSAFMMQQTAKGDSSYRDDPATTMNTDISNVGLQINEQAPSSRNPKLIEMQDQKKDLSGNIPLNSIADNNKAPNQLNLREVSLFDVSCHEAKKKLELLEKKHLQGEEGLKNDIAVQWHLGDNMTHSYYLDTVTNIRSTTKCAFDICMLILILCFVMSALSILREKNIIDNYHSNW